MKKLFTLLSILLFTSVVFGQITINSTDVPIPTTPFHFNDISSTPLTLPALGDNQAWDYSSNYNPLQGLNDYHAETDPFFTSAGIDVYLEATKDLNTSFGYMVSNESDFNSYGVYESGANISSQAYELSTYTSNNLDSIVFPAQQYIFSTPKTLLQFPFTANSSWHSESSRSTNFILTVAAYFLNHAPGVHTYTYIRNDSIVGWGTMRVYTPNGPSIAYDVLMEQVEQYAVDTFYLNGSLAPLPLLTAFSVSQGQHSNIQYTYNFYRAGSFNYLMRFFYGSDNTYTNLESVFVNTDDLSTATGNLTDISYSTILFPNPTTNSEINLKITGQTFSLSDYTITDLSGKIVQQGKINEQKNNELIHVSLNNKLANGKYIITVKDLNNKEVVAEQFVVGN